ncbi:ABC transporter ATP-binding protein [Sporolituus thermophilus]|uniref:Iron(III) transport system ATP-binding protein n=1 Tax=Sporolituus thermophilus DSM 23256 TaxID=1123285 RepID=A0A1G7INA5_9FIRM|nr:ABC transporter ATP-binding protein [Sporolituus thermophilus]SDF13789.1 iron(III) transport system ATP-binding protein [Sporolituus thermophilus DSM 23256]
MLGITLENVSKRFDQVTAVEDINVQIKAGEFFTFLGPSGCGKTTTLRMIAGFYYPSTGCIKFGDRDVTFLPPNKRNIGMVFQNYALFPHMTVAENIAFGLEVRKMSRDAIRTKVAKALDLVRLSGLGDRKINQLSGGQQQRVALARAIVIEPDILLLDEPLSNLDAKLREETRAEIKRLQLELGITTIYVTHDQAEAMALSDRIMVMNAGKVQQIGDPISVYARPSNRFVASFIGETNLITATVEEVNGGDVVVKAANHKLVGLRSNANKGVSFAPGSRVVLSIRPEAFRLVNDEDVANIVRGKVGLAEFAGISVSYLVQAEQIAVKAMVINSGFQVLNRGEEIALTVNKNDIYFVE